MVNSETLSWASRKIFAPTRLQRGVHGAVAALLSAEITDTTLCPLLHPRIGDCRVGTVHIREASLAGTCSLWGQMLARNIGPRLRSGENCKCRSGFLIASMISWCFLHLRISPHILLL